MQIYYLFVIIASIVFVLFATKCAIKLVQKNNNKTHSSEITQASTTTETVKKTTTKNTVTTKRYGKMEIVGHRKKKVGRPTLGWVLFLSYMGNTRPNLKSLTT